MSFVEFACNINIDEIPDYVFQSILDYRYKSGIWTEEYYYVSHSESNKTIYQIEVEVKPKDPTKLYQTHPGGNSFTMPNNRIVIIGFYDIYESDWYKSLIRDTKIDNILK